MQNKRGRHSRRPNTVQMAEEVREEESRKMKRNYIVKIPFHLTHSLGLNLVRCAAFRLHGVPLSLYSLPLFLLSGSSRSLSYPLSS